MALLLTIYRMVYRYTMRRFLCEDVLAVLASSCSIISVVGSWLQFELGKDVLFFAHRLIDTSSWPTFYDLVLGTCNCISHCSLVCFHLYLWETYIANTSSRSARLSVLLSILPFTSTSHNLRRLTIFIAGLFVLMWLSFIISFVAICVSSHGVCAAPSQRYEQETRLLTIFELFGMFFFVVFG